MDSPESTQQSTKAASTDSDAALIARIRAGDLRAFEAIMRKNNQRIFRMARALLGDDAEAEDAMQQAYLSAFVHIPSFEGRSSLSTWLMRIARNEALSRARKRKRLGERPLGDEEAEEADDDRASPERAYTPEDVVAMKQLTTIVEREIDALPEIYRVVFVLREIEHLDTAETAECLELSEELVKVRLHRARKLLERAILERVDASTPQTFVFLGERCDRVVAYVLARLGP